MAIKTPLLFPPYIKLTDCNHECFSCKDLAIKTFLKEKTCELCKGKTTLEETTNHSSAYWDDYCSEWAHSRCPKDEGYIPCTRIYRVFCGKCKHYTGPWTEF